MILKTIIIVLLIGLIISLGSGLVFLFKDLGTTRRTLHSLGVRVALASALMATVVYGFLTGQLEVGAPWDARKFSSTAIAPKPAQENAEPALSADSADSLENVNKEE